MNVSQVVQARCQEQSNIPAHMGDGTPPRDPTYIASAQWPADQPSTCVYDDHGVLCGAPALRRVQYPDGDKIRSATLCGKHWRYGANRCDYTTDELLP